VYEEDSMSSLTPSSDLDPRLISGERVVYSTSKHWAALITDSAWAILMVVASVVLGWIQPDATSGVLGFFSRTIELLRLGLFFGGCGWIIYNAIAWRTAEYTVTNLRVFGHEGLVRRRSSDTLLSSLSDVRLVIPAVGGVLGYGNIRIISASGEVGKDTFTAVHDPQGFKRQILEQKAGAGAVAANSNSGNITQLLTQLTNLRDAGVLTDAEYAAKTAALVSRS
jgi:hypothetical protein